ncbi:Copper transport protein ctr4 [Colletotrichum sidae]|uniref:Copper transport protein n=4 Tax=Colletotrichum orbiculare species complex TaxID=2707354 RepID=N4VDQ7_COLOR|nr:Copper transport protein ctr4 [Colletotrichum orbiculare MAFF 240422]TDZ32926.1 Copper transport protein ctr4 [Colletotrichum spinosum]TDZ41428.1 Copper transport protein ctr4 [Colletotrichum trifolii]TEA20641.1 Copper transport protein ctr4 [Colletotrichum sidae]
MDMDGMSMATATTTAVMTATGTMTGMATATSKAAMGGMGGMGGSGCKISMLWNWNTIGSCYIASSWKITSNGMFAGSCIGVVILVMLLELLRRAVKEYDRYLIRNHRAAYVAVGAAGVSAASSESAGHPAKGAAHSVAAAGGAAPIPPFRPNVLQQAVRALLHVCQFAVAYFVMLLAMYYNGYIIICIFLGSYIGAYIFQWETLFDEATSAAKEATVCCG